jgi:hypothetical protein
MSKIIKNYFMAIVAVVMVVGFSAFKVVESQNNDPEVGWFAVTPNSGDPTNPDLYLIGGFQDINPPSGPNCDITNSVDACQVYLDLEDVASPEDIPGMTLEEAIAAGAKVGDTAYRL